MSVHQQAIATQKAMPAYSVNEISMREMPSFAQAMAARSLRPAPRDSLHETSSKSRASK